VHSHDLIALGVPISKLLLVSVVDTWQALLQVGQVTISGRSTIAARSSRPVIVVVETLAHSFTL
jgi:hypothetical protein